MFRVQQESERMQCETGYFALGRGWKRELYGGAQDAANCQRLVCKLLDTSTWGHREHLLYVMRRQGLGFIPEEEVSTQL
jgi:hypothetical protein